VPFMAILYVGTAVVILFANFTKIPTAFVHAIQGAFIPKAIVGGIVGVLTQGLKRAAFSNEAGSDCSLRRSNQRTSHRRLCRPSGTVHRCGGDLYHANSDAEKAGLIRRYRNHDFRPVLN